MPGKGKPFGAKRKPIGRPPGRKNDRTILLGEQLDKIIPDKELLRLMWDTARGARRQVLDKDGRLVIVQDRPDSKIQAYLADRKWGKVPQPVTGGGPDAPPVRVVVLDDRLGIKYRQ